SQRANRKGRLIAGPIARSLRAWVITVRIVVAIPVVRIPVVSAVIIAVVVAVGVVRVRLMAVAILVVVVNRPLVVRGRYCANRRADRSTAKHWSDPTVAQETTSKGTNARAQKRVTALNACLCRNNRQGQHRAQARDRGETAQFA